MSDHRYIDKLTMPQSAMDAMAKAVPDVVRAIVGDHYKRAAPTPPAPKGLVDTLLEKFGRTGRVTTRLLVSAKLRDSHLRRCDGNHKKVDSV